MCFIKKQLEAVKFQFSQNLIKLTKIEGTPRDASVPLLFLPVGYKAFYLRELLFTVYIVWSLPFFFLNFTHCKYIQWRR